MRSPLNFPNIVTIFQLTKLKTTMTTQQPLSATMAQELSERFIKNTLPSKLTQMRQDDASEVIEMFVTIDPALMDIFASIEKKAMEESRKDYRFITLKFTPFETPLKALGYKVTEGPISDPYDFDMGYYISW